MSTNTLKAAFLLAVLSALLITAGGAVMGRHGLYTGLCLAAVMSFSAYFFSENIALLSYSAQPVSPTENSAIYRRVAPIVSRISQRMKLPMPKLWLIPRQSPNAFATRRNPRHASVALTAGTLEVMDGREIEGVIAHELGHVLHRDILISSVAAMLAGTITMLASMARWGTIFGGRSREYDAEAASAKFTGTPYEPISGLRKLEAYSRRIPMDASPATAHMFIVKPNASRSLMNLFSTHPPAADRIARLQAIR
jgi:heat shock protein HtpX